MIDARTAPYGAFLLRVSLGVMFLAHGLVLKVLTFTIPGTVSFFEANGYPAFFRLPHHPRRDWRRDRPHSRSLDASHCASSHSDHDRRHPASCRQRLAILGQGRRLGVPGILDDRADRAGAARRWRFRAEPCTVHGKAARGRSPRLTARQAVAV